MAMVEKFKNKFLTSRRRSRTSREETMDEFREPVVSSIANGGFKNWAVAL
jgi:hypothetical protein